MQRSVCTSSLLLPVDDTGNRTLTLMLTITKIKTCLIFPSERCRYADAWCEWAFNLAQIKLHCRWRSVRTSVSATTGRRGRGTCFAASCAPWSPRPRTTRRAAAPASPSWGRRPVTPHRMVLTTGHVFFVKTWRNFEQFQTQIYTTRELASVPKLSKRIACHWNVWQFVLIWGWFPSRWTGFFSIRPSFLRRGWVSVSKMAKTLGRFPCPSEGPRKLG